MTKTPIIENFEELWKNTDKEAFRLQTIQEYVVEGDFDENERREWFNSLKQLKKKGARIIRLHIFEFPITDYIKTWIKAVEENQKYGEEVFGLEKDDTIGLSELKDFWLFDDKYVLLMNYNSKGEFLGSKLVIGDRVKDFVDIKNRLMKKAETLDIFLKKRFDKSFKNLRN